MLYWQRAILILAFKAMIGGANGLGGAVGAKRAAQSSHERRMREAKELDESLNKGRVAAWAAPRGPRSAASPGGSCTADDAAATVAADASRLCDQVDEALRGIGDWRATRVDNMRRLRAQLSGQSAQLISSGAGHHLADKDDLEERVLRSELERLQSRHAELVARSSSAEEQASNLAGLAGVRPRIGDSALEALREQAAADAGTAALETVRRELRDLRVREYGDQLEYQLREATSTPGSGAASGPATDSLPSGEAARAVKQAREHMEHGEARATDAPGRKLDDDAGTVEAASPSALGGPTHACGSGENEKVVGCAALQERLESHSLELDDIMR